MQLTYKVKRGYTIMESSLRLPGRGIVTTAGRMYSMPNHFETISSWALYEAQSMMNLNAHRGVSSSVKILSNVTSTPRDKRL
jgi:hypothetical protein